MIADLDGDGMLELLVARAGARPERWRAPVPAGKSWLEVVPSMKPAERSWCEPTAWGLRLEVKAGMQLQTASLASSSGYLGGPAPRAHFGLNLHSRADYVRVVWPDAVLQGELEVAANQHWQMAKQ